MGGVAKIVNNLNLDVRNIFARSHILRTSGDDALRGLGEVTSVGA
jgi:hypothetical protein